LRPQMEAVGVATGISDEDRKAAARLYEQRNDHLGHHGDLAPTHEIEYWLEVGEHETRSRAERLATTFLSAYLQWLEDHPTH
jgi:hypothetical protein